jgi:hypothetical protein
VLLDGINSKVEVAAGAQANYSEFTYAALVNPSSAGEGNLGVIYAHGATTASRLSFATVSRNLQSNRATSGSSTADVSTGLATNWNWVFVTLSMLGDKKPRLFIGITGAVNEASYSSRVAVSSLTDLSAVGMTIGNWPDQSRTFAGLIDEFMLFNRLLSAAEMLNLVKITGV